MEQKTWQPVISILDSTLRDGAQGEGISFSVKDKLHIVESLDELGVQYIEAGNPASNPKELDFFAEAKKLKLQNSKLTAFGSTRRKGLTCETDELVQNLIAAKTPVVVIFGKSWDFHVLEIIKTTLKENLDMIFETISYAVSKKREVIFDAEHFFDGYKENPDYAMKSLHSAVSGGASTLCLCDTKGGSLPLDIYHIVQIVVTEFAGVTTKKGLSVKIGFHAHNDSGLGISNSLMAVEAGATHIQGTLLGFGERTGNANLSAVIANLEIKMGLNCLPPAHLSFLTPICRRVAEIANIALNDGLPYVGSNAFAHKAGMHVDAVTKNPAAYEHIKPEMIGNDRVFLMSEVAGRATIYERVKKFLPDIKKDDPILKEIMKKVKELEHNGYQFEGAEGSFELLARKIIGDYKPFFKLHYYKTAGELPKIDSNLSSFTQLKIEVDGQVEVTAGDGDGPVHALDKALRKALERFYPVVSDMRLIDYKVRVLDSLNATASKVRVLIESSDGERSWTTVGVSSDVIEASWFALVDSIEYKLIH